MTARYALFHLHLKSLVLCILAALLLSACGGTKVYSTNKTVIYRDNMYNITNVQQVSKVIEGRLPDDSTVDLAGSDKKDIEAILKQHGSMFVTMSFHFDANEMPYRANTVESWRDYKKLQDSFEKASKDINKLMKDKKDTQITLR